MQNSLISIIIPIYNVEAYLSACVDKVLNQTYQNLEIILVDDGSPDNCPQMCDKYALEDSRIKVIHKENGGLSDARNAGIDAATGDYIVFIDSDDYWYGNNVLEELINVAIETDADVINFGNSVFYEDNKQILKWLPDVKYENSIQNIDEVTRSHAYISSACMKFMKAYLVKNNPRFEKGVLSEDIVWSANILAQANKFVSVKKPYYCYRQRSNSISKTLNSKSCIDLAHAINTCVEIANKANQYKKAAILRYSSYQLGTFVIVQAIAQNCPDECLASMNDVSWILKYHDNSIKMIILSTIVKLIGFRNTCRIVKIIKRRGIS